MGKQVVSLMWGIRASEARRLLTTSDGEWIWESSGPTVPRDFEPRGAYEGGVLGFKVACSAPDDDEDDLVSYDSAVAVADLDRCFTARKIEARGKWERFHAWLRATHDKTLPEPQLWLTADERA